MRGKNTQIQKLKTTQTHSQSNQAFFQIGNSKFRKSFQQYAKEQNRLSGNARKSLSNSVLVVSYGAYQRYNWKLIFFQMVSTNIIKLFSDDNQNPKVIKQIQHINFSQLLHLHLINNKIQNIEALTFINFEKLNFVYLYHNHITNTKSLVKSFHKNSIEKIILAMNPIVEMNRSSQNRKICFKSQNVSEVILQLYSDSNVMNEDLCGYFFPFFGQFCRQIYIKSKLRINQPKILKMLKRMLPKVQIFQFYGYD